MYVHIDSASVTCSLCSERGRAEEGRRSKEGRSESGTRRADIEKEKRDSKLKKKKERTLKGSAVYWPGARSELLFRVLEQKTQRWKALERRPPTNQWVKIVFQVCPRAKLFTLEK